MNVTYNNKAAIMRRNGQVVLGDIGGITFQFIAIDLDAHKHFANNNDSCGLLRGQRHFLQNKNEGR